MKERRKLLLKTICFIALLSAAFFAVVLLVERKESREKYAEFFASAGQTDVLLLGSSHVINALNPMELYANYGITSYNMGGHGAILQATYWELMLALDYCAPKAVVVDTYMLQRDYQYLDVMGEDNTESQIQTSIDQLHHNMDAFPFSRTKLAAVRDLLNDPGIRRQFLFPYIVYHDRWEELARNDFQRLTGADAKNRLMGAELRYQVLSKPERVTDMEEWMEEKTARDGTLEWESVGSAYLRRIIETCQARGIDVTLTFLPFYVTQEDWGAVWKTERLAEEYGVPYLDLLSEPVIDVLSDLNDRGHLNNTGAEKVTARLGEFLSARAKLPDHRGDPAYAKWEDYTARYQQERMQAQLEQENLYTQLNQLNHPDISSIVYVNTGSEALYDATVLHLIGSLSGTGRIAEAAASGASYLLIRDNGRGTVTEAVGLENLEAVDTTGGVLHYIAVEGYRLLYPDDDEDTNYLYMEDRLNTDVQVLTFDNNTGGLLTHLYYEKETDSYACEAEEP